jgi:MULE transposase domain
MALLPILEVDASFRKHPDYHGAVIHIIAKAGDRRNIPLAMALVPSETIDEYIWFFSKCIQSNIPLENVALFTDQGKQMLAQRRLQEFGVKINLKNCVHHITRNAVGKFSTSISQELWIMILNLQSARTFKDYIAVLTNISQIESAPGLSPILWYMMQLHPTQWSEWGNLSINDEEDRLMHLVSQDIPTYGVKKQLFGVRSTNGIEGEMNALNHRGIRDCLPFEILSSAFASVLQMKTKFTLDLNENMKHVLIFCRMKWKRNLIEKIERRWSKCIARSMVIDMGLNMM